MKKNNLWFYRKQAEVKQKELSNLSSYCVSYISRIEQGYYSPSKRCAKSLAKPLKVSVRDLFPDKEGVREALKAKNEPKQGEVKGFSSL